MKSKLSAGIIACIIVTTSLIGCTQKTDTGSGNSNGISSETVQNTYQGIEDSDLYGSKAAKADSSLTKEEMIIYAIQDEYAARKEYEIIMDKYGEQRPFSNIMKAEEQHIAELKELFNTYGIEIPEDKSTEYISVPDTLNDAYKTGVQAEIDNIDMYEGFLKEDIPQDMKDVFILLRDASKNHLRAFEQNVNK